MTLMSCQKQFTESNTENNCYASFYAMEKCTKYKDDLKKKMLYFSNVEIIEPTGIKWSSIRFQRK